MSKKNKDNTIVQVPAWVLMMKVEQDWNEWKNSNFGIMDIDEVDEIETTNFPEYDSTIKALEVLKENNIHFNTSTGKWK